MEDEFTFSDGSTRCFEMSFQPVPEGVFILSVDVTEKNRLAEAIRHSEERFRCLIENSYDIVSILDETFRPVYRSPSAIRVTGYANDERDILGGGTQLAHPDDLGLIASVMKSVLENPMMVVPLRYRIKHKDGHYVVVDGTITNMLHVESILGIVANFRDITEQQLVEEKIKASENIYKTIAASIPGSVICLFDPDYRYLLIEGDLLQSFGYSKEQLLNNKLTDVISEKRVSEVMPYLKRVFAGESFTIESSTPELDIVSRYVPLKNENGDVYAVMVVIFDVSELKHAQRGMAELNLGLEQKIVVRTRELELVNKELETFSYSIAHDLRTPLRAINGYSAMLAEDYELHLDAEGKRLIGEIVRHANRMALLIDDLLTFSKLGRKGIQKSVTDMNKVVQNCLDDLNLDDQGLEMIKIHDLHPVIADSSLMKQVMINLLGNAIKYSAKKERPHVDVSSRREDGSIVFSVTDNGVGFDMDYADKLFGVFQRLHSDEEFEGTGVGLAIVQRIVHRHLGRIWANSKIGEGATFCFSLPGESVNNELGINRKI